MRKYNVNANIIRVTENLYYKAQSAVSCPMAAQEPSKSDKGAYSNQLSFTSSLREPCVRHWMTIKIVSASESYYRLRFADYIVVNSEYEEEADVPVDSLDTTTTLSKMDIVPDKTRVIINNTTVFQREFNIRGQWLEAVDRRT